MKKIFWLVQTILILSFASIGYGQTVNSDQGWEKFKAEKNEELRQQRQEAENHQKHDFWYLTRCPLKQVIDIEHPVLKKVAPGFRFGTDSSAVYAHTPHNTNISWRTPMAYDDPNLLKPLFKELSLKIKSESDALELGQFVYLLVNWDFGRCNKDGFDTPDPIDTYDWSAAPDPKGWLVNYYVHLSFWQRLTGTSRRIDPPFLLTINADGIIESAEFRGWTSLMK